MGAVYKLFLDESPQASRIYICMECKTHFSTCNSIISKAFQGQHGRAYLFNTVVNVITGEPIGNTNPFIIIDRQMTTGLHTVRDLFCIACFANVGWKYDKAYEESQRYKSSIDRAPDDTSFFLGKLELVKRYFVFMIFSSKIILF